MAFFWNVLVFLKTRAGCLNLLVKSLHMTNPSNTPTHTYYILYHPITIIYESTFKVMNKLNKLSHYLSIKHVWRSGVDKSNCKSIWKVGPSGLHPRPGGSPGGSPWASQSSRISSSFWDKTPKSGTHALDEVMAHQDASGRVQHGMTKGWTSMTWPCYLSHQAITGKLKYAETSILLHGALFRQSLCSRLFCWVCLTLCISAKWSYTTCLSSINLATSDPNQGMETTSIDQCKFVKLSLV